MLQRQSIKWIFATLVSLMVIILAYNWLKSDSDESELDSQSGIEKTETNLETNTTDILQQNPMTNKNTNQGQFKTGIENLPRSLQGTDVDGEIIIDGNNKLVPTRGLRRLFDYFLAALGEESAETIDARIETYISSRTPDPAATTAISIYHQYKIYLNSLNDIQNEFSGLQTRATEAGELDLNLIQQRQTKVMNLRNELFSPETVEAFFDEDNALHDYNISMMDIAKNNSLTESQKQQAREDYVSRLPDSSMKNRVYQKEAFTKLMDETERLKSSGASEAELFAMRSEMVGAPAAERLAIVDQENKNFDQRFQNFKREENSILTSSATEEMKQNQIDNLQRQLFNEAEIKRLDGYAELRELKKTK